MIRQIKENEIAECVAVIRESCDTVAKDFHITRENAPRFTAYSVTVERLQYQFEEKRPMLAYFSEDGKILGYFSLALKDGQECELNNLCVLPQYRHQSIGRQLLDDAFERAKELGCKKMTIGIVEENKVLRQWYENYGFFHTGIWKFDFFPFTCGYMEKEIGAGH